MSLPLKCPLKFWGLAPPLYKLKVYEEIRGTLSKHNEEQIGIIAENKILKTTYVWFGNVLSNNNKTV
jgi:hypothetical protein